MNKKQEAAAALTPNTRCAWRWFESASHVWKIQHIESFKSRLATYLHILTNSSFSVACFRSYSCFPLSFFNFVLFLLLYLLPLLSFVYFFILHFHLLCYSTLFTLIFFQWLLFITLFCSVFFFTDVSSFFKQHNGGLAQKLELHQNHGSEPMFSGC